MKQWLLALGWTCGVMFTASAQEGSLHKKVTVNYRNMNLADALKDLGEKAGVRFACADKLLESADRVTYEGKEQEAGRVATRMLHPQGLRLEQAEENPVAVVKADALDEFKVKPDGTFEFAEKPKVLREGDRTRQR